MKVKAKFGKKHVFEFHQPKEKVRGLNGLLRLPSKEMFLGLPLLLEDLAPGLQLGVRAVQVDEGRQELPLRDLSLRLQEVTQDVDFQLETAFQRAEDWVVKSEVGREMNRSKWKYYSMLPFSTLKKKKKWGQTNNIAFGGRGRKNGKIPW